MMRRLIIDALRAIELEDVVGAVMLAVLTVALVYITFAFGFEDAGTVIVEAY